MTFIETPLKDLILLEARIFADERGYFFESYNIDIFKEIGINLAFMQDNQSYSKTGVIRGLHFQSPPFDQGKLVRVVKGKVLDVVVDIRKNSSTYGQSFSVELSLENQRILYVPPGFAHGFSTLEEAIFLYKCTNVYHKQSEGGIIYNDPDLNINWGVKEANVSSKDLELPRFKDLESPF
jgi:dTDP-4-dehydrorhamnose 3,5-epimerase